MKQRVNILKEIILNFLTSTNMRYLVENPNNINLTQIMKKHVDIHNKKYCFFHNICVVEVTDNQDIKQRPTTNLNFKKI